MHAAVWQYVERLVRGCPVSLSVVEFGSRDINGSVRGLFRGSDRYLGVDMQPGEGVDIVMDAAAFVPPWPVDVCLCLETLEHAPDPAALVRQMLAITRPGGLVVITTATDLRIPHSGVDGGSLRPGEHYHNISPVDLLTWLGDQPTVQLEIDRRAGDLRAWARLGDTWPSS